METLPCMSSAKTHAINEGRSFRVRNLGNASQSYVTIKIKDLARGKLIISILKLSLERLMKKPFDGEQELDATGLDKSTIKIGLYSYVSMDVVPDN